MGSEITQEQMTSKIAAARRDAEGLKDKIKRRKDDLMDTNREYPDNTGCSWCLGSIDVPVTTFVISRQPRACSDHLIQSKHRPFNIPNLCLV